MFWTHLCLLQTKKGDCELRMYQIRQILLKLVIMKPDGCMVFSPETNLHIQLNLTVIVLNS